jgi:two-component system C4-dicarboxylate transport sensor histidine kinase DctB
MYRASTRRYSGIALLAALVIALLVAVAFAAIRWSYAQAAAATDAIAEQQARDNAGLLASELQKFRLLPIVLAESPDVRALLETPSAATAARVDARLRLLAESTDAAVIYVLAADGVTVAASNAAQPNSFVGQNYGFRPYFRGAMKRGGAELFALGTVSGRPGLYLARRIGSQSEPLGVIVVKIEFEAMQQVWRRQPGITFVTDMHGVVIITSRPDWRFDSLGQLSGSARRAIRTTRQYGDLPLAPLPLAIDGRMATWPGERLGGRLASIALPLEGARLQVVTPLAPAIANANANARLAILSALAMIAGVSLALWRARDRRILQMAAQRALESQVAERTAELRESNAQLLAESAERARADRRYREAREELAQANRLGSLGQITAGVAHEINQPVSAIRSFAENAQQFLARGSSDQAIGNLARIVELTQRIGTITAELRNFARRRTPEIGAVPVDGVIDSTLLLIGDRLRSQNVALERGGVSGLSVTADRVRLEQIFINLIQNALDALRDRPGGVIGITVARYGGRIAIDVADNGPGVTAALTDQLFMPFVTGRDDGLGLGLAIARNIARDFGGELGLVASPLGGAAFRITLNEATYG